jgi:hypothetical protein
MCLISSWIVIAVYVHSIGDRNSLTSQANRVVRRLSFFLLKNVVGLFGCQLSVLAFCQQSLDVYYLHYIANTISNFK